MHPIISNLFNLPVTRAEVLKRVNRRSIEKHGCLCYAIDAVLQEYHIFCTDFLSIVIGKLFPKFTHENAQAFGARNQNLWWEIDVWDTGRMDFLNWLISEYKDDKTNLRELCVKN